MGTITLPFSISAPPQRSKKVRGGFLVVNTRTDEILSETFRRRGPARELCRALNERGIPAGVRTLETTVAA